MSQDSSKSTTGQVILVAVYRDEASAQQSIEALSRAGAPLDMLSVLGKAHASGDDVLGISYKGAGSRVEAWSKQGALWGAAWGLLTGAALFILPGVGPLFATGPIVEALGAVVAGGSMGGAVMAGAAALTHLASGMHRMGVPHAQLEHLHQVIVDGGLVLLLRESADQAEPWLGILRQTKASEVFELPYTPIVGWRHQEAST